MFQNFTIRLSEIVKLLSYSFMLQFLPLHYIQYNMYSRYVFILHKLFWLYFKKPKTKKSGKPYDFTTGKPTVFFPSSIIAPRLRFLAVSLRPRLGLGIPIPVLSSRDGLDVDEKTREVDLLFFGCVKKELKRVKRLKRNGSIIELLRFRKNCMKIFVDVSGAATTIYR